MSIITNQERIGNFTSSNIHKLLSKAKNGKDFGKPAITYIEDCNIQREMGIYLGVESNARELQWGKHCEQFAFDNISLAYTITSDVTVVHPNYPFWVGSADGYNTDTVFDLKCPMTRKSFFGLVAGENIYSMRDGFERNTAQYSAHTDADKYYWQLVSNAAILGKITDIMVEVGKLRDSNGAISEEKLRSVFKNSRGNWSDWRYVQNYLGVSEKEMDNLLQNFERNTKINRQL